MNNQDKVPDVALNATPKHNKVDAVKKVRDLTGLGLNDCRAALDATDWDIDKAVTYAKEHATGSDKPVGAGAIFTYVHHNNLFGAILELHCGTDFVARNEDFQKLGNELALHIAGAAPTSITELLDQSHVKYPALSVEKHIEAVAARFNEPIKVARFHRYAVGKLL